MKPIERYLSLRQFACFGKPSAALFERLATQERRLAAGIERHVKPQVTTTAIEECIEDLKHYRTDCSLETVDRVWLKVLTDSIEARPLSRKKKHTQGG